MLEVHLPAHPPRQREAHNQAANGFYFTMVLPESFDLILLSSLLVTLDSPFLELLYVLGYEGLNNPKKNNKKMRYVIPSRLDLKKL